MTTFSLSKDCYISNVESTSVLFKQKSDHYYELNDVAMFLVDYISQKPHTFDQLTRKLCDEFNIDKNTASKDISSFIKSGIAEGYITKHHDLNPILRFVQVVLGKLKQIK